MRPYHKQNFLINNPYIKWIVPMKFNLTVFMLVCVFLSGCSQTQIPYKLVKSVEKNYQLKRHELPFGVTQEKISEKKYRVTAKLTDLSSSKRALSMALYHAAILAEEQGFDAFIVNKRSVSNGCIRSTSKQGRLVATTDNRVQVASQPTHTTSVTYVEPKASLEVTLSDFKQNLKSKDLLEVKNVNQQKLTKRSAKKTKIIRKSPSNPNRKWTVSKRNNNQISLAKTIKEEHKKIIEHVSSDAELKQGSEERLAACKQRRSTRKG
jgi:multidrug efflux pump subunit AcrB